jgi:RNA polymerase sigma factor (sigma-70 family)
MTVLDLEPRTRKSPTPKAVRRRVAVQPDALARAAEVERERELRRLIALHEESVLARCMRVTRDRHDAEDAAQQTFIALSKRLAETGTRGPIDRPQAWLTRVAKRCAIDVVRARTSRRAHESAAATHRSNGSVAATDARDASREVDARLAVQEVLGTLPANYKTPMVLFYFGGQTLEGIAKQLGTTANAVGVKLHRGRSMLAKRLKARGVVMPAAMLSAILAEVIRRQVSTGVVSTSTAAAGSGSAGTMMVAGTTLFTAKARWLALGAVVLSAASTIGAQSSQIAHAGLEAIQKIRNAIGNVEIPKPSLSLPVIPTRIATNEPSKPADPNGPKQDEIAPQYAAVPNFGIVGPRPQVATPPISTARPYTVVRGATIPLNVPLATNAAPSSAVASTAPGRAVGATTSSRPATQAPAGFRGASGGRATNDSSVAQAKSPAAPAAPAAPASPADGTEVASVADRTTSSSAMTTQTSGRHLELYAPDRGLALNGSTGTSAYTRVGAGSSHDGDALWSDSGVNFLDLGGSGMSAVSNGLSLDGSDGSLDSAGSVPRPVEYPALDGGELPLDLDSIYSPLWPGLQYRSARVRAHSLEGEFVGGSLTPGVVPEPTSLVVLVVAGAAMLSRRRR